MVAGDDIGCREIAHEGQRHAARTGITRKHDVQAAPLSDAADFAPFPGLGSRGRPGLGAGQAHKVANLQDWYGSSIGVEIKLHGGFFAQSLGD